MTITAHSGALLTYPQGVNAGDPAGQNPEPGPVMGHHGIGLLDIRAPYTYQPGQNFGKQTSGFLATTAVCVDQAPSAIAAANIAAGQSVVAGTAMTLVSSTGAGITVGQTITNATTGKAVTGLLAIDGKTATVSYGSASPNSTIQLWDPTALIARNVRITTNADDTAGTYKVVGYDIYSYPMTETITGVNNAVASGKKAFKYIASVTPAGTLNSTSVSVGTGDVFGFPLRVDRLPYTEVWWGNPTSQISGGSIAQQSTMEIPVLLSGLANAGVYNLDVPFDGSIISINARVVVAATTSAKAATITAQANGSSVTGGAVSLTSANCTPIGNKIAGSAITAGNTFLAGQTVGFVVSSVTAFVEGSIIVELVVQNADASGGTFTAADTTATATATTGDVRGTFAVPSASDGTKRLTFIVSLNATNAKDQIGQYGVLQA